MRIAALLMFTIACAPPAVREPSRADDDAPPFGAPVHEAEELARGVVDERTDGRTACIDDVPGQFGALATEVAPANYRAASNDSGVIPWPRYTDSPENDLGLGEHFQGIQRWRDQLVLTGGIKNGAQTSQLIFVDADLRVTETRDLDPVLWHAGGFQIADDILAVALETDGAGEVRFYDLAASRELDVRVTRDHKLYAAGLVHVDDHWRVLAWDDDKLELLVSVDDDLEHGFSEPVVLATDADYQGGGCGIGCGTYQSLNFVRGCDGRVFVVGTRNTQKGAPSIDGDDLASLYELTDDSLTFVARKSFGCHDRQCNFAAAAGVAIVDGSVELVSAYHWLQDDGTRLRFNVFD